MERRLRREAPLTEHERFQKIKRSVENKLMRLRNLWSPGASTPFSIVLHGTGIVITTPSSELTAYFQKLAEKRIPELKQFQYGTLTFVVGNVDLSAKVESYSASDTSGNDASYSILGVKFLIEMDNDISFAGRFAAAAGGAIVVDDKLYGLTVGHYRLAAVSSDASEFDVTGSTSHLSNSAEADHINPVGSDEDAGLPKFESNPIVGMVQDSLFGPDPALSNCVDWALMELGLNDPFMNCISVQSPSRLRGALIEDIITESNFSTFPREKETESLNCFVVTRQGLVPAFVAIGTASLTIREYAFDVLCIELERSLPFGSSGSWVIIGKRLLGTVIAQQRGSDGESESRRAFVVPIEDTFHSIRCHLGARRVTLPTTMDNEIIKLERKQRVSRWLPKEGLESSIGMEFLYARRQYERSSSYTQGLSGSLPAGTGWVGVSRTEVMSFSPNLADSKGGPYAGLTNLKLETVTLLLQLGHIFPARPAFRAELRTWLTSHKASRVKGRRAIAARAILDICLDTEAGESLLGLCFVILSTVQVQNRDRGGGAAQVANVLSSLCEALRFPPSHVPSEPQLRAFCRYTLTGFKYRFVQGSWLERWWMLGISSITKDGVTQKYFDKDPEEQSLNDTSEEIRQRNSTKDPEEKNFNALDEEAPWSQCREATFLTRVLLQLSDVAHDSDATTLIYSGDMYAKSIRILAETAFELCVDEFVQVSGKGYTLQFQRAKGTIPPNCAPDVMIFCKTGEFTSEIVSKEKIRPFIGLEGKGIPKRAARDAQKPTMKEKRWSINAFKSRFFRNNKNRDSGPAIV